MHHSRAVLYPSIAIAGAVLFAAGAMTAISPADVPVESGRIFSPLYSRPTADAAPQPDPNRRGTPSAEPPAERPSMREFIEATFARPNEVMRDAYSRHFKNPDGTVTALISPSPIHYWNGEAWATIDPTIVDLKNETSTLRSQFPPTADGTTRIEGITWTPVALAYTNAFGVEVQLAAPEPVAAQVDGNIVEYPGIFPGATDRFEVGAALVKHDLILDAPPAVPPYAGMSLDIVGIVTLDAGLRFDGNWIVDAAGTRLHRLAPPYAGEVNGRAKVTSRYAILDLGADTYELRIQTPADWLLDPARQYPIRIDPTVWSADGVRVDNSYDFNGAFCVDSGKAWSSWGDVESGLNWADAGWGGNNWYDCAVGQDDDSCVLSYDEVYRSAVDWNTTSIPDAATVTNTRVRIYVSGTTSGTDFGTNNIMVRGHHMALDWFTRTSASAHYADCADGTMYFGGFTMGPAAGLTAFIDLGASADGTVQAQLGANWFGLGLTSDQSGSRGIIAWLDFSPLEVTYNSAPPAPSLLTPANGVRTVGNSVGFSWTAVVDPDGDPVTYYLYGDTTATPTTLIYSGAGTSFTWGGPADATTYNWRVRAFDGTTFSAYSATRWFRENGLPPMPAHSDPPNASFQQPTAAETTGWTSGGADPDGDAVTYTWRVDVDNPPIAPFTSSGTGGLTTTPFATADATTYYWHVQANDGYESTAFTGVWSFTADGTAPGAPTLLLPADTALITTDTPTFDWTDVADPSGVTYTIEIDGVPTGGLAASTYSTTLAQGAHTWRVRATDGAGNVGPFSAPFSFTIDSIAPPAPALISPADGAILATSTPSFDWSDVADPSGVTYTIDIDGSLTGGLVTSDLTSGALADGPHTWRVRAIDGAGNAGAWSATRSFTIDTIPPAAPALISPADGAFVQPSPTLTWSAVPDSTYEVELDGAPTSTAATSLPVGPLADGVHAWRVRAIDTAGNIGPWSATWSFTADGIPPPAPALISPADGAVTNPSPTLTWAAVADSTYEVELDGVPTATAATSLPVGPLADGAHAWRARAIDLAGNIGPWSATWSFTSDGTPPAAPALLTPADGAILATSTPSFDWSDVVDPSGVTYTIDIDGTLTAGLATSDFVGGSQVDGPHAWRVRATDGVGNVGPWSVSRSYTIDTQAPPAPTLISPADGAFVQPSPTLTWAAVFDATGVTYTVEFDGTPTTTAATSLAVGPLADGAHSWRVRATDGLAQVGPWSATWTFTVDSVPPPAVTLISPADGSITAVFTTLVWEEIAGATYEVEIDGVPTSAIETSLPVGPLAAGPHAWRARAIDAAGNIGPWSAVWTFTVDASTPGAPTLLLPADSSIVATDPVFFDWTDVDVVYEFEVLGEVTASPLVSDFTASLPDGVHAWRVRAFNAVGTPGPWSATFTFTKATGAETNPPTVPALISPTDGSAIASVPVPLVWMPSTDDTGMSHYEVQLDTEATFSAPILFSASTPATTIDSPILGPGTTFWHVRAVDVVGNKSAWCAAWSFIVTAGDQPPSTPVKLLPPNGFVLPPGAIFFNWTDSTDDVGVAGYDIEVTGTAAWSATVGVSQATSPVLPMGNYQWRVRATDTLGQPSPWSAPWAFALDPAAPVDGTAPTAPAQTTPSDFSTGVDPEIDLAWTSATDAETGIAYYLVEVFNGPLVWSAEVVGTGATTAALANGTYTWRVTAFNGQGLSTPSPSDFTHTIDTTLDTLPPGVPVKVSPLDGSTLPPGLVTFDWLPVADNGMVAYYEIDVGDLLGQTTQTDMTFALPEGTFFWRVRAVDSAGNAGGWSNFWTIVVAVAPPAVAPDAGAALAGPGFVKGFGDGSGGVACSIINLSAPRSDGGMWVLLVLALAWLVMRRLRASPTQ